MLGGRWAVGDWYTGSDHGKEERGVAGWDWLWRFMGRSRGRLTKSAWRRRKRGTVIVSC